MDNVTTRRTSLRPPASQDDRRFVHQVLTDPANSGPFVWHGTTPSVDAIIDELEPACLGMYVVWSRRSSRPVGVVLLTNPNLRDGHAFLTVAAASASKGGGVALEGLIGLIHLAFITWPFHKLYADVDDVALAGFASAVGRYLEPEGCFRDHHLRDGRRVDVHRLAFYRRTWEELRPRIERTMLVQVPPASAAQTPRGLSTWHPDRG